MCIGEHLSERENGSTLAFLTSQLEVSLDGLSDAPLSKLVIAYEPIWAIGTGKVATPEQAQEAHQSIRAWMTAKFGPRWSQTGRIIYGGSVNEKNAASLAAQPDVNGFLIGGASLTSDYVSIIKTMEQQPAPAKHSL